MGGVSANPGSTRTVTVSGERLVRWVQGFGERHGPVTAAATAEGFDLVGADGAVARVGAPELPTGTPRHAEPEGAGPQDREPLALADALARELLTEREVALLVVRRGGYAAARFHGTELLASKIGTRYVQGRTAAGGWSQQRFARRRDNQTSELVGAAVQVAARVLRADGLPEPDVLVTGGDRALVERALAEPSLRAVARLPRGPHLPLGDPRADVVRAVPGMLRSVRIVLVDP